MPVLNGYEVINSLTIIIIYSGETCELEFFEKMYRINKIAEINLNMTVYLIHYFYLIFNS
jgi:hypothetical protein